MLQTWDWLLMGAIGSTAVFFFIFYFLKRDETYNLVFALGCLVTIIRIVFYSLLSTADTTSVGYRLTEQINQLSFIWGPFLFAMLADSLFPSEGSRVIRRIALGVAIVISVLILLWPQGDVFYGLAFDTIIFGFILYGVYIFTSALVHKLAFSVPIFIGNLVFVIGIVHDVLRGSNVIVGLQEEVFKFASLLYAIIIASVLAYRYTQSDKKRLEAQLKFLHAQIQPHFLYNTLGTISAYCMTDPQKASELLNYLSTYLRGKFRDESDRLICLNDEIELVKAYLTIEQARFQGRITVEYNIQDGCNVLLPGLSLQPLVENAVKHGLLKSQEGGKILISVKRNENAVVIKIRDNGVGMDKQQLRDVLEGRGTGIGISNTDQRLKRHFGTGITAVSSPGEGCEFTVVVPLHKGEKKP